MFKTSNNSSSVTSELEELEIEIINENQNHELKKVTHDEVLPGTKQNSGLPITSPNLPPKPQQTFNQNQACYFQNWNPQTTPINNINQPIPNYNSQGKIYEHVTQINNNIHILDNNNKLVFKRLKEYQEQTNYLIAALILTISILFGCNPILLTVADCMIPKTTSNRQQQIMFWIRICMIISWILFIIEIILGMILCFI